MAKCLYAFIDSPGGIAPVQEGASNKYTFFCPQSFYIFPHGVVLVYLKVSVLVPTGYQGIFMALNDYHATGILTQSDVIFAGRRQELTVLLFNHTDQFLYVRKGHPVGTLLLKRVIFPSVKIATLV
ncbi:7.3 kDa protein [Human adenovirus 54]|uniref:7.3 kDa protein n=2 Tax=Human adenovirus 54 TaxID=651580 RepID=C5NMK8_9ADEN|nr:7.3 kDa protein [Human adenovirus 54]BAH84819.1 7.3 kDa protein [Human adenovirus 54]